MIKRQFFGWYEDGAFFLSYQPPDAVIRPCVRYETADEIKSLLSRRGVSIYWSPPLPDKLHAEIENGLRLDRGR